MFASSDRWVWIALIALGCYHGINPAMGWLFAVALGLQERSTTAVAKAIIPIAIGHVTSVTIIVALAVYAAMTLPHNVVHIGAAVLLIGFGLYRLVRARHPRWVGMRVGFWGLVLWGFLMASAHGAGLMLLPFVTTSSPPMAMSMPMPQPTATLNTATAALMIAVHTLAYLLVTVLVALVVYKKLGLSILRTAWFNIDLVWAVALVATGLIAFFT